MKKTQQQRIVEALTSRGQAAVTARKSNKYITLQSTSEPSLFYFVGGAGSLKIGRTYSNSRAVLPYHKNILIRHSIKADEVAASLG